MKLDPTGDDKISRLDFLAMHGQRLIDNGYEIVPIKVGGKAPGFAGWEKSRASREQLTEWLDSGHKNAGVGILTKNTPAIDIDCRNEKLAAIMEKYCREKLGLKLMRIGLWPKRLLNHVALPCLRFSLLLVRAIHLQLLQGGRTLPKILVVAASNAVSAPQGIADGMRLVRRQRKRRL